MKQLELTSDIRQAIEAIAAAERAYVPGRDSSAAIEIPKLRLADAVLHQARLDRLPRRATAAAARVAVRSKRRRA